MLTVEQLRDVHFPDLLLRRRNISAAPRRGIESRLLRATAAALISLITACLLPALGSAQSAAPGGPEPVLTEQVVAALTQYVSGVPNGGFDFEVLEEMRHPPGDWDARAQEHFERCIQIELAGRRNTDARVGDRWRDVVRTQIALLASDVKAIHEYDFNQQMSVEIGEDYVDQRVLLRAHPTDPSPAKSAWNNVLFLRDERVQALVLTREDGFGAESTEVTAQRTRRETQDIELLDSSRWLYRTRVFARECIRALRAMPEQWVCHRDREELVAVWRIDQPGLWPNLFFYQGLIGGQVELRVSEAHGGPLSLRCTDSAGMLVDERHWRDYYGDRFVLPLTLEFRTWYPGSGAPRSSEIYRGRARGRRPPRQVQDLLTPGAQVTDARFAPPVSYIVEQRPLEDAEVIARSSAAAGGDTRSDQYVHPNLDESPVAASKSEPSRRSVDGGPWWLNSRVLGGLLVALGALWAGLSWRATRVKRP